ncbi:MAG: hypothetical protein PHP53_09190 [Prolixibacteraceae bacterium]|nr:hypothetical protein [Prolixibacteraceae bacterium]
MNFKVKINSVKSIEELEGSWSNEDFTELLKRFDYEDSEKLKPGELKEYLFMAIGDFEPSEAAAILLDYKLSEVLSEGQIGNLSHEMLREKISENYSDIYIHKFFFEINQLLYSAYNGKFPLTKANLVDFEMKNDEETELTKELALKALSKSLSDKSLINRLFSEQLGSDDSFPEAEGIIWDLQKKGNFQYTMTASEKWFGKDDFEKTEYECTIIPSLENSEPK